MDSVTQSCLTLCDPMDSSQLASSLAGIPEQVAIPTSGYLPDPEIEPMSLVSTALEGRFFFFFTTVPPGKSCYCNWSRLIVSKTEGPGDWEKWRGLLTYTGLTLA